MWPKKNSAFALFAVENQSVKDKEHKTELGDPLSSLEFWESEWREWVPTGQVVRRDRPRDLEPRTGGEHSTQRVVAKSPKMGVHVESPGTLLVSVGQRCADAHVG